MRRDELIIDGAAVDTGAANIALEYVNNILSDFDKISASHSYTITLPLSARNERIFDYAGNVGHRSEKVGKYLPAEYRRDGITIIKNARAYVSAISPAGVEVCLLWDGLAVLSSWIAEGRKLADVQFDAYEWAGTASAYSARHSDVVEAKYDCGVRGASLPPCVNLLKLFEKVMNGTGVSWNMEVPFASNELQEILLPLCSRSGSASAKAGAVLNRMHIKKHAGVYGIDTSHKVGGGALSGGTDWGNILVADMGYTSLHFVAACSWELGNGQTFAGNAALQVQGIEDDGTISLLASYPLTVSGTASASLNTEFDVDDLDYKYLRLRLSGVSFASYARDNAFGSGTIAVIPTLAQAQVGYEYNVAANLPDISQIDFIKAVCALYGANVVADGSGGLRFVSIDQAYTAISQGRAVDWSGKLTGFAGVPEGVSFTVGDFAQLNRLKWAEDSEHGAIDADGLFVVENETLDAEGVAAELPFAATDGAKIPHYKQNGDTLEDVDVAPRLCYATDEGGKIALTFGTDLYFADRLGKWYRGLLRLLRYPIQIKAHARLTETDLAGLDWVRPVYLRQTGHYYMVKKINTDGTTDVCELELIQL